MNVKASAEILGRLPIFADCERIHLQVLAFSSRQCDFPPGESIIRQDAAGQAAYLILDGTADVLYADRTTERKLNSVGYGSLLGEVAMISGRSYGVTAMARDAVIAAAIDRETFFRLAGEFPEFGMRVQRALARKFGGIVGEFIRLREIFDGALSFGR